MNRVRVVVLLLIAAFIFDVQAAVASDTSFVFVFGLLFFFSFRRVVYLSCAVGLLLDMFSPVKGISLLSYSAGIAASFFLSEHLLAHRSLLSWYVLGILGWITMFVSKVILLSGIAATLPAFDYYMVFSRTTMLSLGQGFIAVSVILLLLYPVVSDRRDGMHRAPHAAL
jgi:hypothetical protein